jgi:hypothetical protein
MRKARAIGIRAAKSRIIKGGNLSNIKKLENDFIKSMKFGKADELETKSGPVLVESKQSMTSDEIKKKFSI